MKRRSESMVTRDILAWLNSLPGCHAIKRHGDPYGRVGEADITGCLGGRRIEIEVKTWQRHATPLQAIRLEEWRKAGAIVGVAHSVEEAQAILKNHD